MESADPDRTLLQAALELGAEAAAVWRRLEDGSPWPVIERGPEDRLPTRDQVVSVWDGTAEFLLPHGRFVFARGGLALAVGGVTDESLADPLEALLVLASSLWKGRTDGLTGLSPS